jgi:hypothetical protein
MGGEQNTECEAMLNKSRVGYGQCTKDKYGVGPGGLEDRLGSIG